MSDMDMDTRLKKDSSREAAQHLSTQASPFFYRSRAFHGEPPAVAQSAMHHCLGTCGRLRRKTFYHGPCAPHAACQLNLCIALAWPP